MPIQQLQHGHGVSITPNDNAYIWQQLFYTYKVYTTLYVGGAGDLHVLTAGGDDITFTSVPAGSFLPVHVAKVFASGTTATGIVALDITTQPTDFTGLLDIYSGAAAAYSLRQLSSSYSGSAIRVRRSSDNAEQNIGFASNELDTTALTSFCGAGNGFVTTWYDQSGNGNNTTQTTAASQPQIVSSGSVILSNGKPTIDFQTKQLSVSNIPIFNNISSASIMCVLNGTSAAVSNKTAYQITFPSSSSSRITVNYGVLTTKRYFLGGRRLTSDSIQSIESNTDIFSQGLISNIVNYQNTTITLFQNNAQVAQSTSFQTAGNSSAVNSDFAIGASTSNNNNFIGNIQELVVYETDQSSNRTGIETNINDFYSIY